MVVVAGGGDGGRGSSGGGGDNGHNHQTFYLPLANNEGHLLPVHFLTSTELGRERTILKQYLNLLK